MSTNHVLSVSNDDVAAFVTHQHDGGFTVDLFNLKDDNAAVERRGFNDRLSAIDYARAVIKDAEQQKTARANATPNSVSWTM